MKLVEVIRTSETSDETTATLLEFSRRLGKVPVACNDTPGYVHFATWGDMPVVYSNLWDPQRFIVNRLYVNGLLAGNEND